MTPFNPIVGAYIAAQPQVARLQSDKSEQVQRSQVRARNTTPTRRLGGGTATDRFEPAVEGVERTDPIHDEEPRRQQRRRRPVRIPPKPLADETDETHLDVKA